MKLLYVVEDRYPPFRVDVAHLFGRCMPALGCEVEWLMRSERPDGPPGGTVEWQGQRVHVIDTRRGAGLAGRLRRLWHEWTGWLRLFVLVRRDRYDVVQVRDLYLAGLLGWLAARLGGAKFCFWMSYPFPESKLERARAGQTRNRLAYWVKGAVTWFVLYKVIMRLADHVFVQSEQMKQDVIACGADPGKVEPVLMAVPDELVRADAPVRVPDAVRPRLLYVGTLVAPRRLDMLVRMLALVRERIPGAELWLVGAGENADDEAPIRAEVSRLGLAGAVHMTGMLPMAEAWRHVEEADICLSPFYPTFILRSTSPTKLVEYLALGKVVVANDHPEQTRVLQESGCGATVPWGERAFADEICRLLASPQEAAARAARGPAYVRGRRTYSVVAAQVDRAYRELLS